jgi:tetratricopeptide (TPR) repeat protein
MCPITSSGNTHGDPCAADSVIERVLHLPGWASWARRAGRTGGPRQAVVGYGSALIGRDDLITALREAFLRGETIQAITGESGMGKTATAIEYARRYADEYRVVLWARAGLPETLVTDFAAISGLLQLPEYGSPHMSLAVGSVLTWLAGNSGWLLILDDAEDPAITRAYATFSDKGHVLLTTRELAGIDYAGHHPIGPLDEAAAIEMVQAVAGISADKATLIAAPFAGVPLALAQIGALISTEKRLRLPVLPDPPLAPSGIPTPVWLSFNAALTTLEGAAPAAVDLLRMSAFLYHEEIPVSVFEDGQMDEQELRQHLDLAASLGLLDWSPEDGTITIHRLVQLSLRASMTTDEKRYWLERAVEGIETIFPDASPETWSICDQLLPHAIELDSLIDYYVVTVPTAGLLLGAVAFYLDHRGQVGAAEPLYQRALAIEERRPGDESPLLVTILNNLALIYETQGRYAEAEILLERALSIREWQLSPTHPALHNSLVNLTCLYQTQGKFDEAEALSKRRIELIEQICGAEHPDLVPALENLAHLYQSQWMFESAETLCERALTIRERSGGLDDPETARGVEALAQIYFSQGRYLAAQLFHERALDIRQQRLGLNHPETALSLASLADLFVAQENLNEAEPLYARALDICRESLGPVHPRTVKLRFSYDTLLSRLGR